MTRTGRRRTYVAFYLDAVQPEPVALGCVEARDRREAAREARRRWPEQRALRVQAARSVPVGLLARALERDGDDRG